VDWVFVSIDLTSKYAIKRFMDYELLLKQYQSLLIGRFLTDMANTSAFLYEHLPDINWVGFYLLDENTLYLGPFQGKVACTTIPLTKGVCGHSASQRKTVVVEDVHQFQGHIACDSRSNSEVVIPLIREHQLIGVLDIDSPSLNRFNNPNEVLFLEKIVQTLIISK
jgi:L-methionine (R)-S-oxide reductase